MRAMDCVYFINYLPKYLKVPKNESRNIDQKAASRLPKVRLDNFFRGLNKKHIHTARYPENICVEEHTVSYNVLLLGETGAGKSTFINALGSYVKHLTLDEALNSEVCCSIPIKFGWQNEDYEDVVVEFGFDRNENLNLDGESTTQNLTIYNYKFQNKVFHFIDTPGFNDTRGYEVEDTNMRNMVNFLKQRFEVVHSVCILLKPDENRAILRFTYAIKQLLSLFDRNVCNNLIFCFTHSSGTDFRPNATNNLLKNIFNDIKSESQNVHIPFNRTNSFFFDNHCFKYLLATKLNVDSIDSKDIYTNSWNISASQCAQLFQFVQTLPPYSIQNMLTISKLKLTIEDLHCNQTVNIQNKIDECRTEIARVESTLAEVLENIDSLGSRMKETVITVREGPYHMICINKNCRKGAAFGLNGKACCPNCPAWIKSLCGIYSNSLCRHCGCTVDNHDLRYHPNFEEKEIRMNPNIQPLIEKENTILRTCEIEHRKLLNSSDSYQRTKTDIQERLRACIAELRHCSLVTYSRECIDQINMEITSSMGQKRQRLQRHLQTYESLHKLFHDSV